MAILLIESASFKRRVFWRKRGRGLTLQYRWSADFEVEVRTSWRNAVRERSNDEVEARGKKKREGTRKSGSVERMNKARKGIKQKQERGNEGEREREE